MQYTAELTGGCHVWMQALRLEPHMVISNQTGIPLQLMQLRPGAYDESGADVTAQPATLAGLPRAALPPPGRNGQLRAPSQPGLRAANRGAPASTTRPPWTSPLVRADFLLPLTTLLGQQHLHCALVICYHQFQHSAMRCA